MFAEELFELSFKLVDEFGEEDFFVVETFFIEFFIFLHVLIESFDFESKFSSLTFKSNIFFS